ncbi:MAG: hypothetical protein HQK87_08010, partial [Nitrospinae bacterium]|nr:hypothetical protein [Nitrospinota bacterium]
MNDTVERFLSLARQYRQEEGMEESAFWRLQVAARDALVGIDSSSGASTKTALEEILAVMQGLLDGTAA